MKHSGRGKSGPVSSTQRSQDVRRTLELAREARIAEAIAITERYLRPGSRDVDFMRYRATLERHRGNLAAALQWAAAAESIVSHPDSLIILASGDMRAGRTDRAVERCLEIVRQSPGHAPARMLMAEALESANRVAEAASALEDLRADSRGVDKAIADRIDHLAAVLLVQQARHGEAVEALDRTLLKTCANQRLVRRAWYLRAKALDRTGRYDEAFDSAARANAIEPAPFDPAAYHDAVDGLMRIWTRDAMRAFPSSDSPSEVPVFIAGMPRSGTSLLDRVIDAHPLAAGVGEIKSIEEFAAGLESAWMPELPPPDCFGPVRDRAFRNASKGYLDMCARLAPGKVRVVNKALSNNRMIGLLARLFPRTRIIHALRDPRDVAISCFMGGFNAGSYPWTTRLDWIAAAWSESRRLMDHWRRETDLPILDVHYESVVSDPASALPGLVRFLGLEWDEACTRFHESRRTVRTLSYDQVNRPLYGTSAGRWRNYERHLRGIDWPGVDATTGR
jgi:tetratricopeptide (TPR) repeat protein